MSWIEYRRNENKLLVHYHLEDEAEDTHVQAGPPVRQPFVSQVLSRSASTLYPRHLHLHTSSYRQHNHARLYRRPYSVKGALAMGSSNAVKSEQVNVVRVVQPAVGQGSDPISDQFQIQG
jgi:hypothetical protein